MLNTSDTRQCPIPSRHPHLSGPGGVVTVCFMSKASPSGSSASEPASKTRRLVSSSELHHEIGQVHPERVRELLERGADTTLKDRDGLTPYQLSLSMLERSQGEEQTESLLSICQLQHGKGYDGQVQPSPITLPQCEGTWHVCIHHALMVKEGGTKTGELCCCYQPYLVVICHIPGHKVLCLYESPSGECPSDDCVWNLLCNVMRQPHVPTPSESHPMACRPARVSFAKDAASVIENLRERLETLGVSVAKEAEPSPPIVADVVASLEARSRAQRTRRSIEPHGLSSVEGMTTDHLRGLYTASQEFLRRKLWLCKPPEELLLVTVSPLSEPRYASVLGGDCVKVGDDPAGQVGVSSLDSPQMWRSMFLTNYQRECMREGKIEACEALQKGVSMCIFDHIVPLADMKAFKEIASQIEDDANTGGARLYPELLIHGGPEGVMARTPPTPLVVEWYEACLRALARFPDVLNPDLAFTVTVPVMGARGKTTEVNVRVSTIDH